MFLHLFHARVPGRLVGPLDPGENHFLVLLGLNRPAEVGDFAIRHVVGPAFQNARGAELHDQAVDKLRVFDEFLFAGGGNREHKTVDIRHGESPVG